MSIPQGLQQAKDYDPRTLTLALGGAAVTDIAQAGWSGDKAHDYTYTPDNNVIVVHGSPDISGTIAVHASSPTIPAAIAAWSDEEFITVSYGLPDDAGYDSVVFEYCKVTSVEASDEEIDNMPTFTIEFQAAVLG